MARSGHTAAPARAGREVARAEDWLRNRVNEIRSGVGEHNTA
jgi:hypothetical protein